VVYAQFVPMTDAYVSIVVDPGAVSQVADDVGAIDAVSTTHVITGEQDIIAQLDLDDRSELPNVVNDEIHGVTGVIDTVTNVAFEP